MEAQGIYNRWGMGRRTLVWAHGLQSSMAHEDELGLIDWSAVVGSAQVVRYDARGHGTADPRYVDRAYRWSALVDDMLSAAGHEGPFVAGGISVGAATAVYTAMRAPRRIQAVVLVTPPAAWDRRSGWAEQFTAAADLVEGGGLPSLVKGLRARPQPAILASGFPAAQEIALRHLAAMDEKALPAIFRGTAASDLPCRDDVRSLVLPALILAWDGDPAHPVETAQALADSLVLSELHVATDLAGVQAWPGLIRDFLGELCAFE